jgi:hypothetical protein
MKTVRKFGLYELKWRLCNPFLQSEKAKVKKHEANGRILAGTSESPKREKGVTDSNAVANNRNENE